MMKNTLVKKLQADDVADFRRLIVLFEDVFEMKPFRMPDDEYLKGLLAKQDFHVFISLHNQTCVGGLTVYTLHQYYSTAPLAYIYDLAVARPHQRKGIGKHLIRHVTGYFKQEGYEEVFVQADKPDGYALDFYRQTSPTQEEDVSHFYYTLKK